LRRRVRVPLGEASTGEVEIAVIAPLLMLMVVLLVLVIVTRVKGTAAVAAVAAAAGAVRCLVEAGRHIDRDGRAVRLGERVDRLEPALEDPAVPRHLGWRKGGTREA
jgi:hypothetical protein